MKFLIYFCIGLISVSLFFTTPSFAQVDLEEVGQTTMNFLQVGVSPRGASLGNAYVAVGSGAESMFYNPAALTESSGTIEAYMSNIQWIADINYYSGAVSWDLGNIGNVGLSLLSVDYGEIIGTQLLTGDEAKTNSLGYKETGNIKFGAYSFGLGYARKINTLFSMGGSLNLVGQNLGKSIMANGTKDNKISAVAANFGIKFYPGWKSFRFAMAIRNFSTDIRYEEVYTSLPLTFSLGMAMNVMDIFMPNHSAGNSLLLSTDFMHPNNFTERLNFGLEYGFMDLLYIRGGYAYNHDEGGMNFGFGFTPAIARNNKLSINYSYSDVGIFNGVNRFSLGISF